jgi:hypothetical protein
VVFIAWAFSAFSISEIADKLTVTGYHDSMPGAGIFKKEGNSYAFVAVKR